MKKSLNKYFADELTSDEKADFLMEVNKNEELKEEFIENQNLLAFVDWALPGKEEDEDVLRQKMDELMRKMEQRKNE